MTVNRSERGESNRTMGIRSIMKTAVKKLLEKMNLACVEGASHTKGKKTKKSHPQPSGETKSNK